MVAPMNDAAPPPGTPDDPIEAIRREIDDVDSSLLALIAQRLQVADKLTALKEPQSGLPLRPGREVALLRRLVSAAPHPLERELVIEVWRALMSASLRRQRVIDVVIGGSRGDPVRLHDVARRHFGARTRISHVGEAQAALQKAAENPSTMVAVTSWPAAPGVGAWWPALSESRFQNLHLIAGLPLLPGTEEPEAAVFAASPTEEAGGDITLIMASDPHHRLTRALNETGLGGREVARVEPRVLIRIDGFIGLTDTRADALMRAGLERVRVLGSYARI